MWVAQYYPHDEANPLITSGGLGTMGFGLPAGIGAKMGRPETEVWVVCGDGGFQMNIQELGTLVQEGVNLKVALIDNGYLGMVRQWQEFFFERRYVATPLVNPNFGKLAEAYGVKSMRVEKPAEVASAIQDARAHDGPVIIDFLVEREENVYPMVPAGANLHDMIRRPEPVEDATKVPEVQAGGGR
jgi:acetolactate synthase-1/2/3 large subunit